MSYINVYIGNYGNYVVSDEVISTAKELSGGRSLVDRRTKGHKHIDQWGKSRDALEEKRIYNCTEN